VASNPTDISKPHVSHAPSQMSAVKSRQTNQDMCNDSASRDWQRTRNEADVNRWNPPGDVERINLGTEDDKNSTLTDFDADEDVDYPQMIDFPGDVVDSSNVDQSRHSITEYFRKYPSVMETTSEHCNIPPTKKSNAISVSQKSMSVKRTFVNGSSIQAFEFVPLTTDQEDTFTVTSCASTYEPAMSIRMSDFSEDEEIYSDEQPQQSSDVDGDYGRLEKSCISPIKFRGGPSSPSPLFHPIVVTDRPDSVASLDSVTSSEDMAFRDGLASLDANIARIQQQLKAGLLTR